MKYFSKSFLITILGLTLFISGLRIIYRHFTSVKASGKVTTNTTSLNPIDSILINGNIEVEFLRSNTPQLSITTYENVHPLIAIKQKGKTLSIYPLKNIESDQAIQLKVELNSLYLLHLKGNTNTYYPATLSTDSLHILAEGNANIHLSDTGNILRITTHGNSTINANHSLFKELYLQSHGNSKADFFITEKVKASTFGLSTIDIKGSPKNIDIKKEDASKINIQ